MLVKLETYKIETGEVVATDYVVTDSPQRAMAMINEAEDEDVKYHICEDEEARSFWASQMAQNKTEAQAEAARANGRKGGRPRKQVDSTSR